MVSVSGVAQLKRSHLTLLRVWTISETRHKLRKDFPNNFQRVNVNKILNITSTIYTSIHDMLSAITLLAPLVQHRTIVSSILIERPLLELIILFNYWSFSALYNTGPISSRSREEDLHIYINKKNSQAYQAMQGRLLLHGT